MSVHVKHLNADSTFLLTFTTAVEAIGSSDGSFTVLTDPWLAESGAPQYHPKFAFAARRIPAHINHLSQIDPPDVVIVSQANTDHCHEETLRQLPAGLPYTTILAHPDAAKKIRSWKYFNASKVHALPTYSDKNHNTVIRFAIASKVPAATPGEATITLIRQPRDVTKLHNAIAITYRPPTDANVSLSTQGPIIRTTHGLHSMRSQPNLSEAPQPAASQLRSMLSTPALKQHQKTYQSSFPTLPLTPPETPPESEHDPHERPISPPRPASSSPPLRNFHLRNPSDTPSYRQRSRGNSDATTVKTMSTITQASSISEMHNEPPIPTKSALRPKTSDSSYYALPPSSPPPNVPLPPLPDRPLLGSGNPQMQSIASALSPNSVATISPVLSSTPGMLGSAKTLSVLYAPHGVSYAAVKPYATTHLVQTTALPLTLVMHPFDRIDMPWWLGGNISAGVPGGVEIVRHLMGRHWVKTHDEDKEERGISLKMLKKGYWTVKEVQEMLERGLHSEPKDVLNQKRCKITELECGQETTIRV